MVLGSNPVPSDFTFSVLELNLPKASYKYMIMLFRQDYCLSLCYYFLSGLDLFKIALIKSSFRYFIQFPDSAKFWNMSSTFLCMPYSIYVYLIFCCFHHILHYHHLDMPIYFATFYTLRQQPDRQTC